MKFKNKNSIILIILILFSTVSIVQADEGMLPLSEIHKLDIKALGFKLDPEALYNPNGISLIDGIINLSGCTASFVSPEGLILTNYHCAFPAIQRVTTKESDFMKNGFMAVNRSKELSAKGYTVRMIDYYKDVSKEVLSSVKKKMNYEQRTKAIEKKIKKIVVKIEKKYPGKRAEVAEMFLGKTYVLFVYIYIKDVRLVYSPPRSIGEYGGEEDNWMWPRHTGDFTFMRAYVAPDGSSAEYSEKNVPFRPKKYLQIASDGVKEEDFVFILGYPGRTFRHRTSHFFRFEEKIKKPYIVDLYTWMISVYEKISKKDRTTEIKLSSSLKRLWNTMKKYKGQLKAFNNLKLTDRKKEEEKALQAFIDTDKKLKKKYGNILKNIGKLYEEKTNDSQYDLLLSNFTRSSVLLSNAYRVYDASIERKKKDTERSSAYMDRNFMRTKRYMMMGLRNFTPESDKITFKNMLMNGLKLKGHYAITPIQDIVNKKGVDIEKAVDEFIKEVYSVSKFHKKDYLKTMLFKTTKELNKIDTPLMKLVRALYPLYKKQKAKHKHQKGRLDKLLSNLIEVKQKFKGKNFIPDANSTLRLTYGHIRGYSPADAIVYTPFTTLTGLIEKNTSSRPFIATEKLVELYKKKDFGPYILPSINDVPVNILYSTDTTGGNSGSPVLNAKGELVGLNFDRVFEATINDYGWDESYSRSIGVDIRYILWFLDKFGKAGYLLKEMNL